MKRIIATLLATALAAPVIAQTYPSKLVRIVVPTSPAGGNDAMARIVAVKLNERVKQSVIVENVPGAGVTVAVRSGHD